MRSFGGCRNGSTSAGARAEEGGHRDRGGGRETDTARGASDIVLTEPGLSVIISAVLTSRAIFQRMKNYTIYAPSSSAASLSWWPAASSFFLHWTTCLLHGTVLLLACMLLRSAGRFMVLCSANGS